PLETVFLILCPPTGGEFRPGGDVALLTGAVIVAGNISLIVASIDDVGIVGPHRDVTALPTANVVLIGLSDGSTGRSASNTDSGVILLRSIDTIGNLGIGNDVIELCRGLVEDRRPALAAIK